MARCMRREVFLCYLSETTASHFIVHLSESSTVLIRISSQRYQPYVPATQLSSAIAFVFLEADHPHKLDGMVVPFGFGVGDVTAVAQLARAICKRLSDSSGQLSAIRSE